MTNGWISLTNNRAESQFVSVARGRHNWLFAYSPEGAQALALMFSITKTARLNGLNPYKYLNFYLDEVRKSRDYNNIIPDEVIERFLPWNAQVQENCRMIDFDALGNAQPVSALICPLPLQQIRNRIVWPG